MRTAAGPFPAGRVLLQVERAARTLPLGLRRLYRQEQRLCPEAVLRQLGVSQSDHHALQIERQVVRLRTAFHGFRPQSDVKAGAPDNLSARRPLPLADQHLLRAERLHHPDHQAVRDRVQQPHAAAQTGINNLLVPRRMPFGENDRVRQRIVISQHAHHSPQLHVHPLVRGDAARIG